jgi:hypothetical protein
VRSVDDLHHVCIVELPLVRPFKVAQRRCIDDADDPMFTLSPSGEWVAWKNNAHHVRSMNVATGAQGLDVAIDGGNIAVSDTGRVWIEADDDAFEFDPDTHAQRKIGLADLQRCLPRGDRELVCEDHGAVTVTAF